MAKNSAKQEFQFAHIETYARRPAARAKGPDKHSVADILGEASRTPGHCPHVAQPAEPEVVEGIHPTELLARHDALVESRRIAGKRNKLDVHTLAASVYTWPEMVEYTDHDRFWRFVHDTLEFHRRHVGPIDSALIHWDETYPHLHIYTSSMDARGLSPGWRAKREVLDAGGKAKAANAAYIKAMEGWQDLFYAEVGQLNGLDRFGPKLQRLTRSQYRAAKFERLEAGDRADFGTQPLPVAECICLFDGFDDRRRRQYGRVQVNRLQHGNTLVDSCFGPIGIDAFKDLLMSIEIMRSDCFSLFQESQQYCFFGDIGFAQ